MNESQLPIARKEGLVIQEMPDEILVYDLETNQAHCLNQTSALVWKACDGKNSIADITELFGRQKKKNVPEDLVWLAIDQLSENNLLEKRIIANFKGHSRRDVIKKIGLAAVIGLPIISSLVAPTAVLAGVCSGATNGDPCGMNNVCCSGQCCTGQTTCNGGGGTTC